MTAIKKKPNTVTQDDVMAAIVKTQYHRFRGTTLTVCCLTLKNNFNVTGEAACVDPANFDQRLGRQFALQKARDKVWAFLGYELQTRFTRNVARRAAAVAAEKKA